MKDYTFGKTTRLHWTTHLNHWETLSYNTQPNNITENVTILPLIKPAMLQKSKTIMLITDKNERIQLEICTPKERLTGRQKILMLKQATLDTFPEDRKVSKACKSKKLIRMRKCRPTTKPKKPTCDDNDETNRQKIWVARKSSHVHGHGFSELFSNRPASKWI